LCATCTPLLDLEGFEYVEGGSSGGAPGTTAQMASATGATVSNASSAASGGSTASVGGGGGGPGSGGSVNYTQDFEGAGLPPGWTSGGPSSWVISGDNANTGNQSAESGPIGDSAIVELSLDLTFDVDGTISFWHSESTEEFYDFLVFRIDGQFIDEWSGDGAWAENTFNVAAGQHTFTWEYDKDDCCIEGSDHVWIDDVSAQNGYMP
jgi:hypothetical protein